MSVTSANQDRFLDISVDEMMRDPLNQEVLESLTLFSAVISKYGYLVPVYTTKSLAKLHEASATKKAQIRDYFNNWRMWIDPSLNAGSIDINEDREIVFAKRALQHFGLKIHDDFWKTIKKNQVIEIYGKDMMQLYRSLSFFKYCGYSLLDISVNEWYVLWERPRMVIDKMTEFAKVALEENVSVLNFDIPKHVLREKMETGLTLSFKPRACLIQFQNIGSVKADKAGSLASDGFICTASGEIIAEGDDAMSIQFV